MRQLLVFLAIHDLRILAAVAAAEPSPQRKLWVNGKPRTKEPRQGRENRGCGDALVTVALLSLRRMWSARFWRDDCASSLSPLPRFFARVLVQLPTACAVGWGSGRRCRGCASLTPCAA